LSQTPRGLALSRQEAARLRAASPGKELVSVRRDSSSICDTEVATDYYSAVGLALRAAVAKVSGVQRGQTAALVGDAPHPFGAALRGRLTDDVADEGRFVRDPEG